ncbi:hypothetical protein ANO11243_049580 [Dothideomycetidae sp. 11243]|nr:hypothetical protein ANO11243_049580 [fungal sp. No.11243]
MAESQSTQPTDPAGTTGKLSTWVHGLRIEDIPPEVLTRAKYLMLDGIACALVGAHLPWSETAAKAIFEMEMMGGTAKVIGWDKSITPMSAALINSTFIQGFELDDWHSEAPLHSNSFLIPSLLAASSHLAALTPPVHISGEAFLLAYVTGLEVGPRVGRAFYGPHILTRGWHSGAVFGPPAAAAAVSKLLDLSAARIEDAFGMACTQACGLMSAQFESDVKRMQHGFAARNGLLAALLAKSGYVGIKRVFEREYGGYLAMFSSGSGQTPEYLEAEVTAKLGERWMAKGVNVKPYSAVAATHGTIDCVRKLQEEHPAEMKDYKNISSLKFEMAAAAFHHGGWTAKRPLNTIGAQMSCSYAAATQIIDKAVLPAQFRHDMLDRDDIWGLIDKTTTAAADDLEKSYRQRATVTLSDGKTLTADVKAPRGIDPALTNEEVEEKYIALIESVAEAERRDKIKEMVLAMEKVDRVADLDVLLSSPTKNPIA